MEEVKNAIFQKYECIQEGETGKKIVSSKNFLSLIKNIKRLK